MPDVIAPLLLILMAGLSAGAVAYGTYPGSAQFHHGLDLILLARWLQWPLVALSLIACIVLMALVISGRQRAWWLLGLAPVLALFVHRFVSHDFDRLTIAENPTFLPPDAARLPDAEWVVGLQFGDEYYAYPYSTLFNTPVVIQSDHEKWMMLMWSAFANRALAVPITHDIKGHDLEVVSMPANALLLYHSSRAQFINGLTGQTPKHERPIGFVNSLPLLSQKMPWKQWRALHPQTRLLAPIGTPNPNAPTRPIEPAWPMPPTTADRPARTRISLIGYTQPIAFEPQKLTATPINSKADGVPITLYRPPDGAEVAFDRRTLDHDGKLDQILQLVPNVHHRKHPLAFMLDPGSNTGWSADGAVRRRAGGREV